MTAVYRLAWTRPYPHRASEWRDYDDEAAAEAAGAEMVKAKNAAEVVVYRVELEESA